jgi:type VI protein secretion system component VasK
MAYGGAWGFLKLIQAGRVNAVNRNTLNVTWQASVQNMYMVVQQYRLQVAGADHPFVDPVFASFNCPTDLVLGPAPAQAAATPAQSQ